MTTALVLLALIASPPITLEEVLQKNYAARGGLERLHALTSTRMNSHNEGGWGYFETVTTTTRGLKSRSDTTSQGMTESQATDGIKGWRTNAFGGRKDAIDMSPDDLTAALDDADPVGPLVDWRSKGHQVELLGQEAVDGSPAWKIRCVRRTGTVEYWFLDADSFIEIKVLTQRRVRGALVEYETEYGNYAKVDGLYFPFSVESRQRRSQSTSRTTIDAVETNVTLDDALFAKPGAPAPVVPNTVNKR
jgi:hypothetical protein